MDSSYASSILFETNKLFFYSYSIFFGTCGPYTPFPFSLELKGLPVVSVTSSSSPTVPGGPVRKLDRDSRRWSIIRTRDVMARMAVLLKDGKNAAGK